ncbi:hypothetical protein V6N13_136163 [Hibiscus sabdariffa]
MGRLMLIYMLCLWAASILVVEGGDPVITFEWKVTYGNVAPLGVPVKGFLINGEFPGPNINSTTNNNVEVNVFNNLEEPLLFTWAAGGFGGLRIHSRPLIPVPYDQPADEFTVMVGDWFNKGYTSLKKILDSGRNLGRADGLHINGKTAKGDGTDEPLFTMEAGKTYRISTSPLIFMSECALPADKEPRDYFLVASSRFTKRDLTATGIVRYLNGNGAPKPDLPKPPVGWACIETGTWSPEKRMNYNLLDAVSRHTIQVFPKSWAAVFITFDNAGMWNIRSEVWDRRYLGQQLYFSSLSPNRSLRDEYNMRDDTLVCGIVEGMPKPPPFSS